MARIAGVDLPEQKRTDIALTAIYGIGRNNVYSIVSKAKTDPAKKVIDLTDEEISRLQKVIESSYRVGGDLRQEVAANIARLKAISSYRGLRHARNLPVHGQRTRSNARTKRGKRRTVGAMRKKMRAKLEQATRKSPSTKSK